MFELLQIRQRYDGETVLDLPRFTGAAGERWLVLGSSGSGKTTLLHLMAGLLRPTEGSVKIAGQPLSELASAARDRFRGQTIGIVFQQLHLIATLTVEQNLLVANHLAGRPQDRERIAATLRALEILDKRDAYPEELSLGQRQRAAIARAVINRPRLLLADEPTSALDDRRAADVTTLLVEQARENDATLVVATHDRRIVDAFDHELQLPEAS